MVVNSSEHLSKEDIQEIIADVSPIYLISSYQD